MSRRGTVPGAVAVAAVALGLAAWAGEQVLKSSPQNYNEAPVLAKSSSAIYTDQRVASARAPTPVSTPRALVSASSGEPGAEPRSKFLSSSTSRASPISKAYSLQGSVRCWNRSRKNVEALGLLVVPFDADHNILQSGRQSIILVEGSIPSGNQDNLTWQTSVSAMDVVEVSVAILSIKFSDGSVWEAPNVELVDFF